MRNASSRSSRCCRWMSLPSRDARRAGDIDLQIADPQHRRSKRPIRTAHQRLQPSQDLGEGVWLGEVVVAPGPHALDPVRGAADRAQHQDRRDGVPLPQAPDQRQAVHGRQPPVDDKRVVNPLGGEREAQLAVRGAIDDMSAFGQAASQIRSGAVVILHDEQAHAASTNINYCSPSGEAPFCRGNAKWFSKWQFIIGVPRTAVGMPGCEGVKYDPRAGG